MDKEALENWRRIRAHMESVGSTDNHFYKRAVKITEGMPDPFKDQWPPSNPMK